MKQLKKGNENFGFSFTEYDKDNPFDSAHSILDWLDRYDNSVIIDIIDHFADHMTLNDFGKEVFKAMELLVGHVGTNKGAISDYNYDFYKRFFFWAEENRIELHKNLIRCLEANKEYLELREEQEWLTEKTEDIAEERHQSQPLKQKRT